MNHYIVKKMPNSSNNADTLDQLAFLLEEQDANELGLNVIWVDDFKDISRLLKNIINISA